MGYHLNCLGESVSIAVSKPMLTEFGIHHILESCVLFTSMKFFQEDFLLRHYDSGECKGRLGHTRASVLWHRAQVIGIFAGFGIVLVLASPLLLLAAPCIFFCDCKHWHQAKTKFTGKAELNNAAAAPPDSESGKHDQSLLPSPTSTIKN